MDNYIVSARKYRPDNFESVVGQDSIAKTLKNSIKTKQLAQAYLFCGPRGVGKTTCARIFAKTINCSNLSDNYEACNKCESCVAFNGLRSMNIHELDAASNNSVDDIRSLIDQVRIPPQIGNYSVYIIDEVHMLSSSAFNAFLKTLEEPPKHVIFILATTEKHKIIPTILSRCQIFDFNRISVEDAIKRLEFVAQEEGITAEYDALQVIAQKADGAMRDALSIFDQIVSFCGTNITYDKTTENLNVLNNEVYFNLTEFFLSGYYNEVLLKFDEILNKGFEASYFINGLASYFRDLLICKEPGTVKLLEVGKIAKQNYLEYAAQCSVPFLFNAISIANEADLKYKQSQNKRLLIELALLKITKLSNPEIFTIDESSSPTSNKIENKKSQTENPQKSELKSDESVANVKESKSDDYTAKTESVDKKTDEDEKQNIDKAPKTEKRDPVKSYSIKDLAKEAVDNPEKDMDEGSETSKNETSEDIGTDSFDNDQLKYIWTKYAETQRSANHRLFVYLNQNIPIIGDENKVILKVANKNIQDKLDRMKNEIEFFLKKELNNKNVQVEFLLDTNNTVSVKKTDEEKLKSMIEQNPEIKNLKDQLNLDFY